MTLAVDAHGDGGARVPGAPDMLGGSPAVAAIARFLTNDCGRALVLEVRHRGAGAPLPFVLTTRLGELELTPRNLRWLCDIAGPAALSRLDAESRP